MNIQSDRNYEDKRKEYKKKYFNLIYQQSTDSKIDTLIQKLKQKKNLIKHK